MTRLEKRESQPVACHGHDTIVAALNWWIESYNCIQIEEVMVIA